MRASGKNTRRLRGGFAAAIVVAAGAFAPASALASSVAISGNTLTYSEGTSAETNTLTIVPGPGPNTFTVSDAAGVTIATSPTTMCTGGNAAGVPAECGTPSGVTKFNINLGQNDDTVATAATSALIADAINGGAGTDTYSYAATSTPVVADLDGNNDDGRDTSVPADGIADEFDNLVDVENLTGGSGADVLRGSNSVDNVLIGGPGADSIDGLTGAPGGVGDIASFATDTGGVTATVPTGLGSTTTVGAGGDTLSRVENLVGGAGPDNLSGNAEANYLLGGDGNDSIAAGAGNDPQVDGGNGDDELNGNAGDDNVTGAAGSDTASFAGAPGPVTASLVSETATGDGTDALDTVERLRGGSFGDTLTGDGSPNVLHGEGGADVLNGDDGQDTLNGNDGADNISGGSGTDAGSGAGIFGGPGNDTLSGDAGADLVNGEGGDDIVNGGNDFDRQLNDAGVFGGSGNDIVNGGGGTDDVFGEAGDDELLSSAGPDTHNGGDGVDEASYATASATQPITADLTTGSADGGATLGIDTLVAIEDLTGGAGNDRLTGDGNSNALQGRGGSDTVTGGGAADFVDGGEGSDATRGGAGDDNATGGGGNDSGAVSAVAGGVALVNGGIGNDSVTGGEGNDLVEGDDGADSLNGNGGDDFIDGGVGADTASFAGAPGPVTASLVTGTAAGDATTADQLIDTENLSGSGFGDTLTGNTGVANVLSGLGGDDTLNSQDGGADTADCGEGSDRANADAVDGVPGCERVDLPGSPETSITGEPEVVTENATPTHTLASSEAGSTFECRYDGAEFAPCSGPGASHTPAEPLAPGEHTFEARATDVAGNTDATPAADTFTVVQAQAPDASDRTPPETFIGKNLKRTSDRTPTFRFAANEPGSRFQCRVDGQRFRRCSSPESVEKLGRGEHVFEVRAIDPSGNVDPTPAADFFEIGKRKRG